MYRIRKEVKFCTEKKGILEEKFMLDVSYRGTCGYKSIILFSMVGIVCVYASIHTSIYNKTKKKVTNHTDKSKRMPRIGCVIVENSREKRMIRMI